MLLSAGGRSGGASAGLACLVGDRTSDCGFCFGYSCAGGAIRSINSEVVSGRFKRAVREPTQPVEKEDLSRSEEFFSASSHQQHHG